MYTVFSILKQCPLITLITRPLRTFWSADLQWRHRTKRILYSPIFYSYGFCTLQPLTVMAFVLSNVLRIFKFKFIHPIRFLGFSLFRLVKNSSRLFLKQPPKKSKKHSGFSECLIRAAFTFFSSSFKKNHYHYDCNGRILIRTINY